MATIAFCGIGLMGSQMASRLRSAGHSLRVWNRTMAKAKEWAERSGGIACDSAAEAARDADEIHLMLADDAAAEAALFGDSGALSTFAKGRLVVDHSTVSVAGAADRDRRLHEGGWLSLQAPVLASPAAVAAGEGLMMVGGARPVFDAAEPTLRQIITRQWYVGERNADAAAFKLMANSLLLNAAEAMAELFTIATASGIERARAMELFGHFDPSKTYTMRGSKMAEGDYAAAFTASMAAKDARLMIEAAAADGGALPAIEVVNRRLEQLKRDGDGELDMAALAKNLPRR